MRKIHILWNNPEISRKNRALLSGVKSVTNAWFSTTWTSTYQSHGGQGAGFCTRKGPDKHLSTVQVRGGSRDDLSLRDKSKGMDLMMLTVNLAFPWLSRQVFTSWIYFGNLFLLSGNLHHWHNWVKSGLKHFPQLLLWPKAAAKFLNFLFWQQMCVAVSTVWPYISPKLPKENFPSLPLWTTPCFNHEPDFNTTSQRSPPTTDFSM